MGMDAINNSWWKTYRKRQLHRMNVENILRKSILDTAKEYLNNSSIAGVKEICEANIGLHYRVVWAVFFSSMVGFICFFLIHIWFDTLTKPLIITMESATYPISDIDFPAIAICNINRISKKALDKYAKDSYAQLPSKNLNQSFYIFKDLYRQMGRLLDYSWVEALRKHSFMDHFNNADHVINAMKMMAPSCSEMLVRCAWAGRFVNCSDIFTVRRTVRGHCCAFNFILDYDSTGRPNKTMRDPKRQIGAGAFKGLNMILDPMLDDYSYPLSHMAGFDVCQITIFLFDPTHFADPSGGRVTHRIIEPNKLMILELQSVKQMATDEVRKYPLKTRQCLFHDEEKQFGDMYSFSACLTNCRIRTIQTLCRCTPYFLPSGKEYPTCTLEQLSCLNKYKEKLLYLYPQGAIKNEGLEAEIEDSLHCPECLPDCEFTQHFTTAYKIPITLELSDLHQYGSKQLDTFFRRNMNFTNKSVISVYQSTSDCILDRLDVISYWFEVVSNIGGFAGIFLGFSFVAVVEIIYFFTIRFIRIFYRNYKKYHY